jgi:hypothetical protein
MDDTRAAIKDHDPADISPEAARDKRKKEALLFSDEVQVYHAPSSIEIHN